MFSIILFLEEEWALLIKMWCGMWCALEEKETNYLKLVIKVYVPIHCLLKMSCSRTGNQKKKKLKLTWATRVWLKTTLIWIYWWPSALNTEICFLGIKKNLTHQTVQAIRLLKLRVLINHLTGHIYLHMLSKSDVYVTS